MEPLSPGSSGLAAEWSEVAFYRAGGILLFLLLHARIYMCVRSSVSQSVSQWLCFTVCCSVAVLVPWINNHGGWKVGVFGSGRDP